MPLIWLNFNCDLFLCVCLFFSLLVHKIKSILRFQPLIPMKASYDCDFFLSRSKNYIDLFDSMALEQLTSTGIIRLFKCFHFPIYSMKTGLFLVSGSKLNSNGIRIFAALLYMDRVDYRARQYFGQQRIDLIFMEWLSDSQMRVHGLNLNQINNHHSMYHVQYITSINSCDQFKPFHHRNGRASVQRPIHPHSMHSNCDRFIFRNIAALLSFYRLYWV